ncbi:PUA domain-containing protein, partial [Rhodovulum sulfidophilum]
CTWFRPKGDPRAARKGWIAAMKPHGFIRVDAGAAGALTRGKSLLPAGVTEVTGDFGRGEPVAILGPKGEGLGAGLSRYTSAEARLILGCRSGDIEAILGYPGRAALIHRDDMAI